MPREDCLRRGFLGLGHEEFELGSARRATERLDDPEHMAFAGRHRGRRGHRDVQQRTPALGVVTDDLANASAAEEQCRGKRVGQADAEIEAAAAQPKTLAQ